MNRLLLVAVSLVLLSAPASAQLWTDVSASRVAARADLTEYRVVALDANAFERALASADRIPMPLPDGGFTEVGVTESSVMAPALQARYPQIQTYAAQGDGVSGRLSWTEHGFKGLLFSEGGTIVVDPLVHGERGMYAVYWRSSLIVPKEVSDHLLEDALEIPGAPTSTPRQAGAIGETLRTYRMAATARGEYTAANGGTVASGLAAVVASINRVNALFERDLSLRFELVATNDQIIYTNASTDPFTVFGSDALPVNQTVLDREIGTGNYDIGHMIGFNEGGGVAYVGVACNATYKGQGVSGVANETSAFDLLVLPHEIGHQMGAPHAYSVVVTSEGPRSEDRGVEPFMGYTIMSYGQFATGGANPFRPSGERIGFFFHGESIRYMNSHVRQGGGAACGINTPTGNSPPVVTLPSAAVSIPSETPFTLTGSATDESGTQLTYTWEQIDAYGDGSGSIPLFRSLPLSDQTTRTFPDQARAFAGNPYPDEMLPDRAGTYNFQLIARDNVPGSGAIGTGRVRVTVIDSRGPFAITSQRLPLVYAEGAAVTVDWAVAGTDSAPYNAATVDVDLSTDNGATWTVVASGVANDGSETFTLPAGAIAQGRVRVRPAGQVFFAASQEAFSTGAAPSISLSDTEITQTLQTDGTATQTLQVGNSGPSGSSLQYQVSVENISSPGAEPSEGVFGYVVTDSDDADGPTANFVDISDSGTRITFSSLDDGKATITLPFSFPFFRDTFNSAVVSTNGYITLGETLGQDFTNQSIPSTNAPNGIIAPMWDDLILESGNAYTVTLPDGRFVIQYSTIDRYQGQGGSGGPGTFTFQVLLSPDGTIEYQYGAMTGTTVSATVGIEDASGEEGIQIAFNEAYVTSNKAVRFAKDKIWVRVGNSGGTVASGASADVPVLFDASGFSEVTLTADLVIRTNDGGTPMTVIPISMTVSQGPVSNEQGPRVAEVSLVSPNPAGSRASVRVTLVQPQAIRATVVDALGREVAVLHDGQATGTLDLDVEAGRLATGVYVVRVVGADWVESRQMVVAR